MLLMTLATNDNDAPRDPQRRRGGIVWQPHYEGFTTVAYQHGRAIAGISGPWSNQYVLIWWEQSQAIRQLEVYDSIEEAKIAVARHKGFEPGSRLNEVLAALRREAVAPIRLSWLSRLQDWLLPFSRRAHGRRVLDQALRRYPDEETDLRGLNFRASR